LIFNYQSEEVVSLREEWREPDQAIEEILNQVSDVWRHEEISAGTNRAVLATHKPEAKDKSYYNPDRKIIFLIIGETLITIRSDQLSTEELIKIAASLTPA
jgi:hypothetical protein